MHQMNPHMQQKYQFLNHLKHGNLFYIVEIDTSHIVSSYILQEYNHTLKNRAKHRYIIKADEKNYDDYVNKM